MKRLFFALWPNEQTRQRCVAVQNLLSRFQPVAAPNLHVTLVFLGQIESTIEQALVESAAKIVIPEITIVFDRMVYWKKPQILCLTGADSNGHLLELVQGLTALVKQQSIPTEERPYIPHITLARKARFCALQDFEPIIWRSRGFCLVQSCSMPTGVEYRVIRTWGTE